MKKVLMILSAACFMFVVACGPSAEETAAEQKRVDDSTAAAIQHVNDSIASATEAQRVADATAAAAAEAQRVADSTAAAKAKAPKKKTNEQKLQEDKKVLEKQKG